MNGTRRRIEAMHGAVLASVLRTLSGRRVVVEAPVRLVGTPLIFAGRGGSVSIRAGARLISGWYANGVSPAHPCSIRTICEGAIISIGAGLKATGVTICARSRITIGDNVVIGSDALIVDSDFHAIEAAARRSGAAGQSEAVVIGDDVFIGARSVILKGVTIGDGAVVGAGSVVTRCVPAGAVVAGNPAREVRRARRTK